MKTAKRFILSLSALMLLSGVALAAPAAAHDGNSGRDSSNDIVEASSTGTDDSTTGSQTEAEVENHAHDLAEQFKAQASSTVAEKKAQTKTRTQEARKTACEARKTNLTKRMSNAVDHANKHKAVFDKIYTRVKDFHDTKKLDVADYDALVAKVDTAQASAATSISALSTLDVSVDCSSQNVAASVSAFQQAVKDTRDSLKAYRSSIVDLITSLKGASTAADNSSTDNTTEQ